MQKLFYIFQQLLVGAILLAYLQFQYLDYCQRKLNSRKKPLQAKYQDYQLRVFEVDRQLRQLNQTYHESSISSFDVSTISPLDPNRNITTSVYPKSRMIQPDCLVLATQIVNDPQQPCSSRFGSDLTLVVMVYNRVHDHRKRNAIRETFGKSLSQNPSTRIYFVVGRSKSSRVELTVGAESVLHQDLIRVDFVEDYYNCTIKAIAIARWISLYCPFAKFVLKLDDDSFVRVDRLLKELATLPPHFIMGRLNAMSSVFRDSGNSNKWKISPSDYPGRYYPPYIVGIYIIPGRRMIDLYESIVTEPLESTVPALAFDDVYITGIVARKARIIRSKLKTQLFLNESIPWNNTEVIHRMMDRYSILWDGLNSKEIETMWQIYGNN